MLSLRHIKSKFLKNKGFCILSLNRNIINKYNVKDKHIYVWNDMFFMRNIDETIDRESQTDKTQTQSIFKDKNLIKSTQKGIYILMPFIVRALDKLMEMIDHQMVAINAHKILMPTLVDKQLWIKSDRWTESGPELFRLKDRFNNELCLAPTHEEVVTHLMASVKKLNQKQLPVYLYQITSKFRDELRPKHGLLRGREFIMKDLYTFDCDENEANNTYNKVCNAYDSLFKKLDLPVIKARGSVGSIGGKYSDEYLLVSDLGEDQIFICNSCKSTFNAELVNSEELPQCISCNSNDLTKSNAIEVGHAFLLGNKYSHKFNANFNSNEDQLKIYEMGCYGLGVSRILAASVEVLSQGNSIRWPIPLAPFNICIIIPKKGSKEDIGNGTAFSLDFANILVEYLNEDIFIDDRTHLTIGKRLLVLKSFGIPFIIIAGKRIVDEIPKFEIIDNYKNENYFLTQLETLQFLESNLRTFQPNNSNITK